MSTQIQPFFGSNLKANVLLENIYSRIYFFLICYEFVKFINSIFKCKHKHAVYFWNT